MARGGPIARQNRFRDKVGGHACILQVLPHNPGLQIWQQAIIEVLRKTCNYYITSHSRVPYHFQYIRMYVRYLPVPFICKINPWSRWPMLLILNKYETPPPPPRRSSGKGEGYSKTLYLYPYMAVCVSADRSWRVGDNGVAVISLS